MPIKKAVQYLKDVRSEMLKVSWPGRDELVNTTVLVVVFSLAFSVFVYLCDMLLNAIIGFLLKINM